MSTCLFIFYRWKSWQCPTWMPVSFQGVGLGVFTGCLILVVILPLYLSSVYKGKTDNKY